MEQQPKKRAYSGIQPSGTFTLGNYMGAIRHWAPLQSEYECMYCVADLHAITVRQKPAELRRDSYQAVAMLLAAGIDPQQSILFLQSHVPQHAELAWVLSCNTMFGELSRMTQFKDKSAKHSDNITAGLFTYPSLMAADILLYRTDIVPVGEDQKQHLELTRDIAQRFNNAYSETFVVPSPLIHKQGARLMSLQDPMVKMSKSDPNQNAFISMTDDADTILRKCKRAVTDSEAQVYKSPDKPGVSNLMDIYAALTGKNDSEIQQEFDGRGYGDFKQAVAQSIIDALSPIQKEYENYMQDKSQLDNILKDGAQRAAHLARKTLDKVYRKVGFLR